jgi:hypothetical protein
MVLFTQPLGSPDVAKVPILVAAAVPAPEALTAVTVKPNAGKEVEEVLVPLTVIL